MLPYRHMTASVISGTHDTRPKNNACAVMPPSQELSPWFEAYGTLSYFSVIDINVVKHRSVLASLVEEP